MLASLSWSLVNFRLELLKGMVARGHRVIAIAPDHDPDVVARLSEVEVEFEHVPMARTGTNPARDLSTLIALTRTLRRLRPDCTLAYTMKPIIYGGIAARMIGVPERHALMTGLGYTFSDEPGDGWRKALLRSLGVRLYRSGLRGTGRVFTYNEADDADIRRHGLVGDTSRLLPVAGSGVDLGLFHESPVPSGRTIFLMTARMLADKGVREFAQAARCVKREGFDAEFHLLGPLDENPTGIRRSEIDGWEAEGILRYLGETRDVRPYLSRSHVFVLPSYYREGVPRSLLEALATGRPIVTTDMPGCRETVEQGRNGCLVRPRDAEHLTARLRELAGSPSKLASMGRRSRELAERKFDVHRVNALLLDEMGL